MIPGSHSTLQPPFVGRGSELALLRTFLNHARDESGRAVVIRGPGGVGKSRLAEVLGNEARADGWRVAHGKAFPVGTGAPFAIFSDALTPVIGALDDETVTVLARGTEGELAFALPSLRRAHDAPVPRAADTAPAEIKTRLFWNFSRFLLRMAERQPLLLILEDLHWADESSLELLHFLVRQIPEAPIALLGVYNDEIPDRSGALVATIRSLRSQGVASEHTLEALAADESSQLIQHTFDVPEGVIEPFARLVYDWTRGNPFFLVEVLRALVSSDRLRPEGDAWVGWELRELEVPATVRETLETRLATLSDPGRRVAELASVVGGRVRHDLLSRVSGLDEDDLLAALDELREQSVLLESEASDDLAYDFPHPLLRETLYSGLGRARGQRLHARIGETLEELLGEEAPLHADELAFHFSQASGDVAPRAVRYLGIAGRTALERHANREAADYLDTAVELARKSDADGMDTSALVAELARARQRLGEFDQAVELWQGALDAAYRRDAPEAVAALERRLGLCLYWSGERGEALEHYRSGLEAAERAEEGVAWIQLGLAMGVCLQEMGRAPEAGDILERALQRAEAVGDSGLLARVHRALLTLHTWTGPAEKAREHGDTAAALAREAGSTDLLWSVHWSRAVFFGLTGEAEATARALKRCEELADELGSPLRRLQTSEVALEYLAATGEWDEALALGETSLDLGRTLGQAVLLPRLLVSTALIYLGRGDFQRARRYVDEAWELSGAGDSEGAGGNIHCVVPAHLGRTAYLRWTGEYDQAVRVGEAGLAIAEGAGYLAWGIHRLLPMTAEAYLEKRDMEGARRMGKRLREYSERLGHRLGLAWADACDAMVAWLSGDPDRSIGLMRNAAEELETIPFVHDAARVRRQLAGRLAETDHREDALPELRVIHDVFDRLGAKPELDKTRSLFRELDSRPPVRIEGGGMGALTGREIEIARLVAQRKSNKRIGKELDISPRTVSTHLSNIYRKLEVSSRGELADRVREGVWLRD